MRGLGWACGWLAACGVPSPPPAEVAPVEARAWLEEAGDRGGTLVVQVAYDPAGRVSWTEPAVDRLSFTESGSPQRERIGAREVVTTRWTFTGAPGSYEIPALVASWSGEHGPVEASTSPLFVDLGVPPLGRDGELADLDEPGRVWDIPWGAVAVGGGVSALLLGGVGLALWRGRAPAPPVPVEPPDVRVLRAWDAIRGDASLSDEEKATRLSGLFRDYVEEVLGFPATAWTSSEILDRLGLLAHLPEGNLPRAKRLLRATDRVKFAGVRAGADLFAEGDADLRAFVASTRPRAWSDT